MGTQQHSPNRVTGVIGNIVNRGETFWHDYFSLEIDGLYDHDLPRHVDADGKRPVSQIDVHAQTIVRDLDVDPVPLTDSVILPDLKNAGCSPRSSSPIRRPGSPSSGSEPSCLSVSAISACVMAIVCVFVVLGRDYVKYVLLSLENSNIAISFVIFALLFTTVSFPIAWGYILLNVAAGYLYGLAGGLVIVVSCAMFGVVMAHLVIQHFLRDCVQSRLVSASMRSIVNVVESEHGFKVIVLARLTPIPFGLQNALFAMSNISLQRYILASASGMLPCQGLHAYVGSTLRSMEEVISTGSSSNTAYFVFSGQLLMVLALFIFVVRKARMEFNKAVQQAEGDYIPSSPIAIESSKSCSKSSPLGVYGVVTDCAAGKSAV